MKNVKFWNALNIKNNNKSVKVRDVKDYVIFETEQTEKYENEISELKQHIEEMEKYVDDNNKLRIELETFSVRVEKRDEEIKKLQQKNNTLKGELRKAKDEILEIRVGKIKNKIKAKGDKR